MPLPLSAWTLSWTMMLSLPSEMPLQHASLQTQVPGSRQPPNLQLNSPLPSLQSQPLQFYPVQALLQMLLLRNCPLLVHRPQKSANLISAATVGMLLWWWRVNEVMVDLVWKTGCLNRLDWSRGCQTRHGSVRETNRLWFQSAAMAGRSPLVPAASAMEMLAHSSRNKSPRAGHSHRSPCSQTGPLQSLLLH